MHGFGYGEGVRGCVYERGRMNLGGQLRADAGVPPWCELSIPSLKLQKAYVSVRLSRAPLAVRLDRKVRKPIQTLNCVVLIQPLGLVIKAIY